MRIHSGRVQIDAAMQLRRKENSREKQGQKIEWLGFKRQF
jgi:hypothetical protein